MSTPSETVPFNSFDELIFKRELNEVHLLLDFVSGRPNLKIGSMDLKVPKPGSDNEMLSTYETIKYVCKLKYPPDLSSDRAADAALVILVKDTLSALAYPARGVTIAYTYSFVEPTGLLALPGGIEGDHEKEKTKRQTRITVAREAYPGLYQSARSFRRMHRIMTAASISLTLVAALLLWMVTYGVLITSRFEDDRNQVADAAKKIYAQVSIQDAASQPVKADQGIALPLDRCGDPYITTQSMEISSLCNDWSYLQARYARTISDACTFATHFPTRLLMIVFPSEVGVEQRRCRAPDKKKDISAQTASTGSNGLMSIGSSGQNLVQASVEPSKTGSAPGSPASSVPNTSSVSADGAKMAASPASASEVNASQEDIQSITLVLSIYSNYVLPIVFGLLGTAASMLRSIGNKITDCVLAPRDAALAFLQMPLGLMAGVAVGLFFSPTSVAKEISSGMGVLTITASGIAFLAGYGADGFFRLVDKVINHMFSLGESSEESPKKRRTTGT